MPNNFSCKEFCYTLKLENKKEKKIRFSYGSGSVEGLSIASNVAE